MNIACTTHITSLGYTHYHVYLLVEHADYVGGPFRVLIPEGEQEATVTVGITNDDEEEPNEKFNVIITPVGLPSGISAKEGGDLAEITILNDDCKYLIIAQEKIYYF